MRRLGFLGGAAAALALAVPAAPATAADECNGLMACIPVAGPWVVVPGSANATASARWRLACPQGAVGGTDARVSERALDVSFPGRVGSPVGPGVTTTDAVVFSGRYAGAARRHVTAFRPYIGCIPATGGRRIPTAAPMNGSTASAAAAVRPGTPVMLRTKTLSVAPGQLARGSLRCRADERLLRSSTAVGLLTTDVPTPAQLRSITVVRAVRAGRVLVSARRPELADGIRARVQIQAECAR